MANETSKSCAVRTRLGDFEKYLRGQGVDIGAGDDLLKVPSGSVTSWDQPQGNATFMSGVPDHTFDFVYSSHCLEHIGDVSQALENWMRITKPGGYLYIVVPDYKLYEKCRWPSSYNGDHKSSFSLHLTREEVRRGNHYHIFRDLMPLVARTIFVEARLEDEGFDYSMSDDVDQTRGHALCQICLVLQVT
jgi:SAM-dependent methyltransferase